MALIGLVAASLASSALASAYLIRGAATGRRLDGYGSLSGGGATSRLLFQYPEPQLSEILDYLFKPNYGASLHLLKVEIGGDGQSSEGVEPSHSHFLGDLNFQRGYEWRMMVEAKRRNPDILISALAWAWPGYVGVGTQSPWTNNTLSTGYVVDWMRGAREVYNVTLDYVDADWNERGWSPDFVKELRSALDTAGFGATRIICGDDAHTFACAREAATDPVLAKAVYALGSHHPLGDPFAETTGFPLWGSELEVADPGGTDLATFYAQLYQAQNITGYILWNTVSAYSPALFAPDQGIFRAWWPWSGHYELSGRAWVMAHHTQATAPGWLFLLQGAGTGNLTGGGMYTSLVDPPSGGFTLILYKPAGGRQERASFSLTGPPSSITALHAFRSTVTRSDDPDVTQYFLEQPDVAVVNGSFSLLLSPGDMWTLSTVSTMRKGAVPAPPPPASPFNVSSYADDFNACPEFQEAAYWTDMTGSWECVPSSDAGHGPVVMRQSVPVKPVTWWPGESRPFSVFQAEVAIADSATAIDFNLPSATDAVMLGARANPNCEPACGRVIDGENLMPGLWFYVAASGEWGVWNAVVNVTSATRGRLASGTLSTGALTPGTWHTLRLVVSAGTASGFLGGQVVFSSLAIEGAVPATGFPAFGTGSWGQHVLFDNFALSASTTAGGLRAPGASV